MTLDRSEQVGLGVALALHAALLWALGLSRQPADTAPSPPIEVSFVDEAGLQSAAPTIEPAAQSYAPEVGAPEEAGPAPAEQPIPQPTPRAIPDPAPPQPRPLPRQSAPAQQPQRAAQPQPSRRSGTGDAQANRGSRLGPDLLKGIGNDPVSRSERPSGATVSAQARASMDALILRALLPCQRQPLPTPEASAIQVRVEVTLRSNGSLASARVLNVSNDDPDLRIYEQRMRDLALNVVRQCAPITGLPAEYYDVPRGWRRFNYTFPRN